jgi:hypothetical protein
LEICREYRKSNSSDTPTVLDALIVYYKQYIKELNGFSRKLESFPPLVVLSNNNGFCKTFKEENTIISPSNIVGKKISEAQLKNLQNMLFVSFL